MAILFLTVYLLSTTELHQLLKLPMVFEHFYDHQKENKEISFLQFLDMHYMHGSPNDKDINEDMKLPFKAADNCSENVSPVQVPQFAHVLAIPVISVTVKKGCISKIQFISTSYLSGIWQPPKSC